jgi:NADH-quinone oxidoreductase subunit N
MTIFMLSLAGIPPTVGFFAKLFVFQALVTAHLWIPLIVGILTTVISLYYYLRVIVVMVTVPEGAPVERERVGLPMTVVVGLSALGTTLMGLVPQVFGWALQATRF